MPKGPRDAPHFDFQNNPKSGTRQIAKLPHRR
jgi:hypothetical protein